MAPGYLQPGGSSKWRWPWKRRKKVSDTPTEPETEHHEEEAVIEREFEGTTDVQMPSGTQIHQEGEAETEINPPDKEE
jgi:hypothetical protein